MKVLPKKELEELVYQRGLERGLSEEEAWSEAIGSQGFVYPGGEIVILEGTTSRVKLHEIGHQELGRSKIITETPAETLGDIAHTEMAAEKYSFEAKGKEVTYRIGASAVRTLMYDEKQSPKDAVDIVVEVLEKYMGIPVPRDGKAELLRWAKQYKEVI